MDKCELIRRSIAKVLHDPTPENVDAAIAWFWQGLPDGDEAQPLRFLIYGIRALSRRGKPITRESLLAYLRYETIFMASPCRKLLISLINEEKQ